MLDACLSDIPGLIHVGANEGQERDAYAARNLSVLWIEALPNVREVLSDKLSGSPKQRSVSAA